MKTPTEVFTSKVSSQHEAHEMMIQFIVANGTMAELAERYFRILSDDSIGLATEGAANALITKGIYALAYFVNGMECAFTMMPHGKSCLAIVIGKGITWTDFINEFKMISE